MKKLLTMALLAGISCYSSSLIGESLTIKEPETSSKDYALANQALFDAARNGNIEGIKKALKAGAHIDAVDKKNGTALMHAAANGHYEAVKFLIEAGAYVPIRRSRNYSFRFSPKK